MTLVEYLRQSGFNSQPLLVLGVLQYGKNISPQGMSSLQIKGHLTDSRIKGSRSFNVSSILHNLGSGVDKLNGNWVITNSGTSRLEKAGIIPIKATNSSVGLETVNCKPEVKQIFISHCSQDVELAERLIRFLLSAINISPAQIRCTSVNGFRLKGGKITEEQLRSEIETSSVMIGILTPNSLSSLFVSMELGARWFLQKPLIPLVAQGMSFSNIQGPLSGINGLNLNDQSQIFQLAEDIVDTLGGNFRLNSASSYKKDLDTLHHLAISAVRPSQ